MPMDKEARLELLKKAREAKQAKKKATMEAKKKQQEEEEEEFIEKVEAGEWEEDNEDLEEIIKPKAKGRSKQTKANKEGRKTLELTLPEREDREINETIRVKAPTKKKIIKRTVEVEESDTEEEVIEEVVRIPRKANEVKVSRKAMLDKLAEQNRMRLLSELFP